MKITDLFRRLAYGELSNLSISGDGSGVIVSEKHPQLIGYVNDALLNLHSRFVLSEKSVIVEQVAIVVTYELRRKFAQSAQPTSGTGGVAYAYIKDMLGDPFTGDVIRILEVHDSDGNERPLNDRARTDSVFTPMPDVLQVPRPEEGQALALLYQARHPVILDEATDAVPDLLDQEVNIPFALEGALQRMIASSVYSHMNGQENILKSQEYLQAAEAICAGVEMKDLASQSQTTSHLKFEQRGFV